MCGILGFVGPRSFDREAFGDALDSMAHRGPDDRGIFEEPECILGHRRLSILDLSAAGHQPMASRDGRYVIVYNGEIYNFRQLRKTLEADGVSFRSNTDTEVVLELFAREGPRCLLHFRGMYAFAIWDTLDRSLFLARDPLGIKPLYHWLRPRGIAFASELRALRWLPGGPADLYPNAIAAFLAWGSVPEPRTILDGVELLRPGSWAVWKDGEFREETFWQLPDGPSVIRRREEAIEALRPALREAVALRCISDAPLGAFLSGGIDSSSVVALMRAAGHSDLRTFSISFPDNPLDEGRYARSVAEKFATRHSDVPVTHEMAWAELGRFFSALDQPTCDGFNTYLVSRFAKEGGLTVSLSGLGGDELFAGYGTFSRTRRFAPLLGRLPGFLARTGARGASALSRRFAKLEALALEGTPVARLYYAARGLFAPGQIRRPLHPDVLASLPLRWSPLRPYGGEKIFPDLGSSTRSGDELLRAVSALELRLYMRNQLLRDSDVFGMANSLEIRVPLIDHRLVETVFSLDPSLLVPGRDTGGVSKALLLAALPGALPRECTHRPKMGFTFPLDDWMRGPWREELEDFFESTPRKYLPGVLRPDAANETWRQFLRRRVHWSRPWSLLILGRVLEELRAAA